MHLSVAFALEHASVECLSLLLTACSHLPMEEGIVKIATRLKRETELRDALSNKAMTNRSQRLIDSANQTLTFVSYLVCIYVCYLFKDSNWELRQHIHISPLFNANYPVLIYIYIYGYHLGC